MLVRVGSAKVARISGVRGAPSLGKRELMTGLKGAKVPVPQEGRLGVQLLPPGRAATAETSARSESFEIDMMASDAIATQWDEEQAIQRWAIAAVLILTRAPIFNFPD